jgi:hypothetical protein
MRMTLTRRNAEWSRASVHQRRPLAGKALRQLLGIESLARESYAARGLRALDRCRPRECSLPRRGGPLPPNRGPPARPRPAVALSPRLLSPVEFDEDLIGGCHQIGRIRKIVWRYGNAPQQLGQDLRPIPFLECVELFKKPLGALRHEVRVPSSRVAVKGTVDHGHLGEPSCCVGLSPRPSTAS